MHLKDRRELKACKGFRDLKVQRAFVVTKESKDIQERQVPVDQLAPRVCKVPKVTEVFQGLQLTQPTWK